MPLRLLPCLHDWWEQAGALENEYFWQDLFVARLIFKACPAIHVDVGSRLDGFVAHLASFREVDVFDIRPLAFTVPGVNFRQADMMNSNSVPSAYADSVSCLHAIEHFGLGRYGDPIAADGVERGLRSLAKILKPGGLLYLSCPLGDDAVYFNAHRVLQPGTLQAMAAKHNLILSRCWLFNKISKELHDWQGTSGVTASISDGQYSLVIYVFNLNRLGDV
jgi:SAM-dependent methyltransferase